MAHDSYVTYQESIHNDVLLPTVDHSKFINDKKQLHDLLHLLYNKLAIEHRSLTGGSHELFLQFDENRRGVLSKQEFYDAMARVGVTLTDQQLSWLVSRFDCDHDGGVNYGEFVRMLTAWRGEEGKAPTTATGLMWDYEKTGESLHKEADEQREARKRVVEEQYKKTHSPRGRESMEGLTPREVLAKLARRVYDTQGGMKNAFNHWDKDKDHCLSKEELRGAMEDVGMEVPDDKMLDRVFRTFDIDQDGEAQGGGIKFWEFVRSMSEACDGLQLKEEEEEDPSLLPSVSDEVPVEEEEAVGREAEEGAEKEKDEDGRTDKQVLSEVAVKLHEHGLHAHGVIKQLMPETDGTVDAEELKTLLGRVGVPASLERCKRLMTRADLMHNGRLASWELVRLIGQGTAGEEEEEEENVGPRNV